MQAEHLDFYAERDINRNYKTLRMVIVSEEEVSVKQALKAARFIEDIREKKEHLNNWKRHGFTREDALIIAQYRENTGASYRQLAEHFKCSDGYAYNTLKKYGLIKERGGRKSYDQP